MDTWPAWFRGRRTAADSNDGYGPYFIPVRVEKALKPVKYGIFYRLPEVPGINPETSPSYRALTSEAGMPKPVFFLRPVPLEGASSRSEDPSLAVGGWFGKFHWPCTSKGLACGGRRLRGVPSSMHRVGMKLAGANGAHGPGGGAVRLMPCPSKVFCGCIPSENLPRPLAGVFFARPAILAAHGGAP